MNVYFEMTWPICKHIFPSLNVPLQIGKVAIRVHVSQFGNPQFRIRG